MPNKKNTSIEDFWNIVQDTMGKGIEEEHQMAIFKRCMTILVTKHRVVLRLGSADRDHPIHVYDMPDLVQNLIPASAHKDML